MTKAPSNCFVLPLLLLAASAPGQNPDPLGIGVAGHAFDHLGGIGEQGAAAAASGATIIYATGFGSIGYDGLTTPDQIKKSAEQFAAYNRDAKAKGIQLAIGYVCATSIVKLESFDRNWPADLRARFRSGLAEWLQQDRDGKPLRSWYGGDYRPACMNNPDWRNYEEHIIRLQLESGHDGIFFDNPTVHPQGCYCPHCMKKFAAVLGMDGSGESLRKVALDQPKDFLRFRGTIAADFLADMRARARKINPDTLITCNNSLNSPAAFFSQCRDYGYNIDALSRVEDFVLVEDMATQPRVLPDGSAIEYGHVYEMLHAIAHGKPVVVTVLADGDYHTPPNLVRLAMAEAAAHGASYLSWPTWPENVREKMIAAVRPQADLLRQNAALLNGTKRLADVTLLLPFEKWVETPDCQLMTVARALSQANIQFQISTVRGLDWSNKPDSREELQKLRPKPTVVVTGPTTVRAVVREKGNQTIVHLLNLNIQKVSSFEDRVTPASDVQVRVRCQSDKPTSVIALSADADSTQGAIPFTATREQGVSFVTVTVSRLSISTILVIE